MTNINIAWYKCQAIFIKQKKGEIKMFKKIIWLGFVLSIILPVFSLNIFAYDYTYFLLALLIKRTHLKIATN